MTGPVPRHHYDGAGGHNDAGGHKGARGNGGGESTSLLSDASTDMSLRLVMTQDELRDVLLEIAVSGRPLRGQCVSFFESAVCCMCSALVVQVLLHDAGGRSWV
jgi:hypothetical protein